MAEKKKKAYQRFEELTRQATARGATNLQGDHDTGLDDLPADAVLIRLSPEVRRALVHQAVADGTPASEIVEEALRRHLGLSH